MYNKTRYYEERELKRMLFDPHCHLNVDAFEDDAEAAIKRAENAGVSRFAVVGFDAKTIKKDFLKWKSIF